MTISTFDLITFLTFIAVVVGVSIYYSKKHESATDYFLAGRTLSWWMIGLSLIASNISTEHFVGQAGQGFRADMGLAIASFEWIGAAALVLVGLFLMPRFLKAGIFTMPQYLEQRYNATARLIMSFTMLLFYVGITMATVLYAGGVAMHNIFDISLVQGIWFIGVIAGGYTMFGGLKAVVYTDVMQGTALLLGGLLVTWLGIQELGGLDVFIAKSEGRLHTVMPLDHPELPWLAVFLGGMWIPNIFYFGLNQFITQRVLGAKSIIQGQKGILFAANLKLIVPFIIIFPGIIAFELYGDQIAKPDDAYPTLLKNVLPAGLTGIMLAALFGATMSTLDSLLNSASTIFTVDIWKHFRKDAPDRSLIRVGQYSTLAFTLLACLWAPIVATFEGGLYIFLQLYWGFIQPGIVAAFIWGIAWKKVPSKAAIIGMILNIPIYGALLYWLPQVAFLHHMMITFVLISLFIFIYTKVAPAAPKPAVPDIAHTEPYRLSAGVKWWSVVTLVGVGVLYWVFR